MKTLRPASTFAAFALLALAFTSIASAQIPNRTWVSGVGSDQNPCSRTAPCLTFNGALSKTVAGGEIDCLDPGDFAPVTITKSVTIDCAGNLGSILNNGGTAININAGANDLVTIRNLTLNGGGIQSLNLGVNYQSAKAVHLENVHMTGFNDFCVQAVAGTGGQLMISDSNLENCGRGVSVASTSGTLVVNIHGTRIWNTNQAVATGDGTRITISDCSLFYNTNAIIGGAGANGSTVTIVGSTMGYSTVSTLRGGANTFILAFGNTFVNNALIYDPNGGTIFTGTDNVNSANGPTGTANGGNIPKV